MRKTTRLIIAFFIMWVAISESTNAEGIKNTDSLDNINNAVLVQGHSGELPLSILKTSEVEYLNHVGVSIMNLQDNETTENFIEQVRIQSDVMIEEDKPRSIQKTSNDPYLSYQWSLPYLNIPLLWNYESENEVVVAVIDSGLEIEYPDLKGHIAPGGYNFLDNNSDISDMNGHGTAVSTIIAADVNNKFGSASIGGHLPIKVLPLKIAGEDGKGTSSNVIRAIDYAIEQGVDVINISMAANRYSALEEKAIQAAIDEGIIVIAATGNDGDDTINYPASYDDVISVGAIGKNNERSEFSNYNNHVDIVAPGENIFTTMGNDEYYYSSGTSYAAPFVTVTAAVLKSFNRDLNQEDILQILSTTAKDLGVEGKDPYYGFGLIQPLDALQTQLYTIIDSKADVPVDKVWSLTFNVVMKESSFNRSNTFILDENYEKVSIEYDLSDDGKILYIYPPKGGYKKGETYTLIVEKNVQSAAEREMEKSSLMKFTIEN
ncbi:S8 family peptidase [Bacillus solimangrovi]|uniref:Uncharacterized protein n=1 Tax=Bacillus solimangrovi TaxID=1305675 RepID=A0A1E5LDN9_9BACI|nr:S8 family serine peptidase [Bacillus solimangrovi]OEH92160.1 hypothetical protein BFG57_02500 [Bacillus solimangrovi]